MVTQLRRLFDIRPGEAGPAVLVALYLGTVVAAFLLAKPVRNGLFLAEHGALRLVYVYASVPVAVALLVPLHARLASGRGQQAVHVCTLAFFSLSFVGFWYAFTFQPSTRLSALFYVWVNCYGVIAPVQVWTLASSVFDSRQARRLFGFLAGGASLGSIVGGFCASVLVGVVGTVNLILVMVALLVAGVGLVMLTWRVIPTVPQATEPAPSRSVGALLDTVRRDPYARRIALLVFVVAIATQWTEFQVSLVADQALAGSVDLLTRFFGRFNLALGVVAFLLQFASGPTLRRFGVGVGILCLPFALGVGSLLILCFPTMASVLVTKGLDQSLRFSIDKASYELLYVPIDARGRASVKATIDVIVSRLADLVGAVLLGLVTGGWLTTGAGVELRVTAAVNVALVVVWVVVAMRAKREYLRSFRRGLETRQVQPDQLGVGDLETIETLVEELAHPDEGRVLYAIDVLEILDKRNLVTPLLLHHQSSAVRARALAALGSARAEIAERWAPVVQTMIRDADPDVRAGAVGALANIRHQEASVFARTLLSDPDPRIVATAAVALSRSGRQEDLEAADTALSSLAAAADENDVQIRRDLAAAIRQVGGESCRHLLIPLLQDSDAGVAAEAMRSVRALPSTDNLFAPTLISLLGHRRLKSGARNGLVAYGESVVAILGYFLRDAKEDIWVRRHIPATLARIPCQASMDALAGALAQPDSFLGYKVLVAINKLRRDHPELTFQAEPIEALALKEGRGYFNWLTLHHNLFVRAGLPADSVLALTLDQKLGRSVDRIYRLLGLIYPWKDIAAARWAVEHGDAGARSNAFEYLDNILASRLRRGLMPVLEDLPLDEKVRRGNVVLKTRPRDVEETMLQLINDDDQVVAAAAIDLVREKEIWTLTDDVEFVLAHRDPKDWYVFEAASWTLASRRLTSERRRALWLEPLPAAALVGRLRGLPMFVSVGIDELFRITGAGDQVRLRPATTLLHAGGAPDNLFVLLDGRVVASRRNVVQHEIAPPATIGFDELLSGGRMSSTIKTLEPCVFLRFDTEEMRTLLADSTDLVQGFFRTLAGQGPRGEGVVIKGLVGEDQIHLPGGPLTPIQKVLAMQPIAAFSQVSALEMRHLAAIAHQVELQPGAVLSGEAGPPVVHVVLSGTLSLEDPDGSTPPLRAEPGDVVGLHDALAGTEGLIAGQQPRRLTVAVAGSALRIDGDDLLDLLGQRPDLLQQIFSGLFDRGDGRRPPARGSGSQAVRSLLARPAAPADRRV